MSESCHSPESYALIGSMFITNAEGLGCDSFFYGDASLRAGKLDVVV